jgi:hypothetical protein
MEYRPLRVSAGAGKTFVIPAAKTGPRCGWGGEASLGRGCLPAFLQPGLAANMRYGKPLPVALASACLKVDGFVRQSEPEPPRIRQYCLQSKAGMSARGMIMTDRNQRIQYLTKRREELQARVAKIKEDYGSGLSADFGEQAVELENAEVQAEISRIAVQELEAIELELRKLGAS